MSLLLGSAKDRCVLAPSFSNSKFGISVHSHPRPERATLRGASFGVAHDLWEYRAPLFRAVL
jgi:hypothetical protein